MEIKPEFKIGDTAVTSWGKTITITDVNIDICISYEAEETIWMEDELHHLNVEENNE
jgi:hypothetical protein